MTFVRIQIKAPGVLSGDVGLQAASGPGGVVSEMESTYWISEETTASDAASRASPALTSAWSALS